MIYGYARVSTDDKNLDSQIAELKQLGCLEVKLEKASAKSPNRTVLEDLISKLEKGDVLIVIKIDRLARSLKDLIFLLDEIAEREAILKLGASNFDFSTVEGRLTANLLGSVAEFERQLISERTKLGLKSAKALGRLGGRPKGFTKSAQIIAKKAFLNRKNGLTVKENLLITGIKSRETLFKYIHLYAEMLSESTGRPLTEDGLDIVSEQ